jgi:hypothetical protein
MSFVLIRIRLRDAVDDDDIDDDDMSDGAGDDVNGMDSVSDVLDATDEYDSVRGSDGNDECCEVVRIGVYVGLNCLQSNKICASDPQHLQCMGVLHVRAVCPGCVQLAQKICRVLCCDERCGH